MKVYAGINLYSSNNYVGIINNQDQRVRRRDGHEAVLVVMSKPSKKGTFL